MTPGCSTPRSPTTRRNSRGTTSSGGILARFIRSAAARKPGHSPELQHTFADGTPTWAELITREKKDDHFVQEYHYIQAVFFKPTCLMDCHASNDGPGRTPWNTSTTT